MIQVSFGRNKNLQDEIKKQQDKSWYKIQRNLTD